MNKNRAVWVCTVSLTFPVSYREMRLGWILEDGCPLIGPLPFKCKNFFILIFMGGKFSLIQTPPQIKKLIDISGIKTSFQANLVEDSSGQIYFPSK